MIKTYLVSDTHFCHDKIIQYENRPFQNSNEMNETIIKNWNNTVKKTDNIFVLGDFGLGSVEQLTEICNRLNGYKTLILGNHDRSKETMLKIGFNEVSKYPIVYKGFYIMSHQPLYMNENMPYVNIHGHIHSKAMEGKQYFNVSVERLGYKPILFDDIVKELME
jgi:calcineurin-like phosphoesterase family protein